jgi:predicted tellurium resistance membrane protein TerC
MITRLALYSTLAWMLSVLGYTFYSAEFWCVVALFWASETLTRMELIEQLHAELQALRRKHNKEHNNDNANEQ